MMPPARGLYAIADTATIQTDPASAVKAAIAGGAVMIQYRDKSADDARRRGECAHLAALCRDRGIALIVNDDVALAAASGAAGVHLGDDDAHLAEARAVLGANAIIGRSCYNSFERARKAAEGGADYVACGSFFVSPTKPGAVRAPLELLTQARELGVPVCAIGGITPANAGELVEAGADLVAVINGVFGQSDPQAAARDYMAAFKTARAARDARQPAPQEPNGLGRNACGSGNR